MNSASERKKTRRVETDDSPNSASERNSVFGFRRDSASRRVVGLPKKGVKNDQMYEK